MIKNKKDINIKNKNFYLLLAIVVGILICINMFMYVPSGDDYNRLASQTISVYRKLGYDFNKSIYNSLNGRILGNLFSFLFIGQIQRTIVKSICVLLIIKISGDFLDFKKKWILYPCIGILIFLAPIGILRQAIIWNAGFYNYIPPLVLILIILKELIRGKDERKTYIILFLSAFLACLFVENLTLYIFSIPFIYGICFWKDISLKRALFTLAGGIIGLASMFSSPVYRSIKSSNDAYRSVGMFDNLFSRILDNWRYFMDNIITRNLSLVIVFSLLFLLLIFVRKKYMYSLPLIVLFFMEIIGKLRPTAYKFNILLTILFYGLLFLCILIYEREGDRYRLQVFLILSILASTGPLLIVSPIGARNFFTAHFLNSLLIIDLIFSNCKISSEKEKNIGLLAYLLLIVILSTQSFFNYKNFIILKERERIISEVNKPNTVVKLSKYPYPLLIHSPGFEKYENYYFFKEKGDIIFEFID